MRACAWLVVSTPPTTTMGGTSWHSTSLPSSPARVTARSSAGSHRPHAQRMDRRRKKYRDLLAGVRYRHVVVAVRGERLALTRLVVGPDDRSAGAPRDELLQLYGLDQEGRLALQDWYDPEDIDAALAELDAAHARLEAERPRTLLENAASHLDARFNAVFGERRWDEVAAILAEDTRVEDRRAGLRREVTYGRDSAPVHEIQAMVDLGLRTMTSVVVAVRGERLALTRTRYAGRDTRPDAFYTDILRLTEINSDSRCVASIVFDPDDLDGAFAELDARYLAGEAGPHAHAWSIVIANIAAFNRHEFPARTPDAVTVDHRKTIAFASGDEAAFIRATWEQTPDLRMYVEGVHRLSEVGAVVSFVASGSSFERFGAEWRGISVSTIDGDRISRGEVFDEADLDAALARFDEIDGPVRRLESTANRVTDRFLDRFAARDWDAMAQMVSTDIAFADRRRVVNADLQVGRDLFLENFRAAADFGGTQTSAPMATRGDRVVLVRARFALGDGAPEEFGLDLLHVVEIDADERVVATITFDADDVDAAFAELDARYAAGEAAPHAPTWAVVTGGFDALNRSEIPAMAADFVDVDHRTGPGIASGDLKAYFNTAFGDVANTFLYVESVHRLSGLGAVVTHVAKSTTLQGLEAEWRVVDVITVDGGLINRSEFFDEADLGDAHVRFEELSRPATRLENAASRMYERFVACWAAHDWDAMAETIAEDILHEDRRRMIGSIQRDRDAVLANMRAVAKAGGKKIVFDVVATRGDRLALGRTRVTGDGEWPAATGVEVLNVIEVDADDRFAAGVAFDSDDRDAAFEELDARYLAGQALAHARAWSVIQRAEMSLRRKGTACDDQKLGESRSPGRNRIWPWRHERLHPSRLGARARCRDPHRGGAPAERRRGGVHAGAPRRLAGGIRCGMAARRTHGSRR